MLTSRNRRTDEFLRMGALLGLLETSSNKAEKADAIKAARENGLITADEAVELAIEYC